MEWAQVIVVMYEVINELYVQQTTKLYYNLQPMKSSRCDSQNDEKWLYARFRFVQQVGRLIFTHCFAFEKYVN